MKTIQYVIVLIILSVASLSQAQDSENLIVTSLKPIHSLTKSIVGDSAEVSVLIDGAGTPHTYQLKPSQRKEIAHADMIIFASVNLEHFLSKLLKASKSDATIIELSELSNLPLLPIRESEDWESDGHDHGNHGDEEHHEDEDEEHHGDEKHHEDEGEEHHGDEEHHEDEDEEHHEGEGDHSSVDPHVWLNPGNAKIIAQHIATEVSKKFPSNADLYQKNLQKLHAKLDQLDAEIEQQLADINSIPYIVFHDAYQYYDTRYQLNAVGSITLEPNQALSIKRVRSIREKINRLEVQCAFSEPQFDSKILKTLQDDNDIKVGILDPLGANAPKGESHYFELMRDLANNLKGCLGNT